MDFQQTIGWILETTDWIGLIAKSTKSISFNSFSETSKCQTTDWNDKSTGCFSTSLLNNLFQKYFDSKLFYIQIQIVLDSNKEWITHHST